jgi:hypothetical protein
MKKQIQTLFAVALACLMVMLVAGPAMSQNPTTDDMQILKEKVRADKKLLVAMNMEFTESEAKKFWPVYEAYQKDLGVINQRITQLISAYAEAYNSRSLTDDKAASMAQELVAVQQQEGGLQASYLPRLNKVLPPVKVVRYFQIENKIRAGAKYELAQMILLAE